MITKWEEIAIEAAAEDTEAATIYDAPAPRNTYSSEEQERNDTLKAQHIRQAAYAARFCKE